jgi:hypothetical protein
MHPKHLLSRPRSTELAFTQTAFYSIGDHHGSLPRRSDRRGKGRRSLSNSVSVAPGRTQRYSRILLNSSDAPVDNVPYLADEATRSTPMLSQVKDVEAGVSLTSGFTSIVITDMLLRDRGRHEGHWLRKGEHRQAG